MERHACKEARTCAYALHARHCRLQCCILVEGVLHCRGAWTGLDQGMRGYLLASSQEERAHEHLLTCSFTPLPSVFLLEDSSREREQSQAEHAHSTICRFARPTPQACVHRLCSRPSYHGMNCPLHLRARLCLYGNVQRCKCVFVPMQTCCCCAAQRGQHRTSYACQRHPVAMKLRSWTLAATEMAAARARGCRPAAAVVTATTTRPGTARPRYTA